VKRLISYQMKGLETEVTVFFNKGELRKLEVGTSEVGGERMDILRI